MLHQINTRVWLTGLSRALGRRATLDDIPDAELDRLVALGFDWVWLLSVWQTGPAAQAMSRAHAGYSFRPGLWITADIGYVAGGRSSTNGVPNEDRQANMRYGLTFSAPLARGWSAKLALSSGFITRASGDGVTSTD